ncbi:MAG: hypothetical protein ABW000_18895 [Actinoplanes sp.]
MIENDPRGTVLLSLPDEHESGPGSALAKLRWHLAQTGLDGTVTGETQTGPREKNVSEILEQTPAALVYLASATVVSSLVKVAGEWARSRGKRAKLSVKGRDGKQTVVELWNLKPDDLTRLLRAVDDKPEG